MPNRCAPIVTVLPGALAVALALAAGAVRADLLFGTFNDYDPVEAYAFGHPDDYPAVGITYVRSTVDGRHTDIRLSLDHPDFTLVGHSCPHTLARGKSCMVFMEFEPRSRPPADPCDSEIRGELIVRSADDVATLQLSGHRSRHGCVAGDAAASR